MIGKFLVPATALMGRLKYAQKFVVIALVLLAPLAFVARSYLAQQNGQTSRGVGKFYDMFGSTHSAGALMAWLGTVLPPEYRGP